MHTGSSLLASITIFGSGRLGPTASALLGLAGTVIGVLALTRWRGRHLTGNGLAVAVERRGGLLAIVLGASSIAFGVLFLAAADAGPGTGNGVVGSGAAIVLGLAAIGLGALVSTRRRHAGVA